MSAYINISGYFRIYFHFHILKIKGLHNINRTVIKGVEQVTPIKRPIKMHVENSNCSSKFTVCVLVNVLFSTSYIISMLA